ncbi:MAG: hypothetical protein AABW80_02675 [Nanoarchaeota archaeon]
MDSITIPASITLERSISHKEYIWKSKKRVSNYHVPYRRAVIRFTNRVFAGKINKLKRENRQIELNFKNDTNVKITRTSEKKISMQGYSGNHPYVQIIINSNMPSDLWKKLENTDKKSVTFGVDVEICPNEWKDVQLKPSDFLIEIEKESKILLDKAIEKGFRISKVSKGREFDVSLINLNNSNLILAISSHVAKTKSRSKEKTIQKILMDICKMIPCLYENKSLIPVVITRPIEFENSWSFTTKRYLDFYRDKFGFKFITTDFKKGWEDNVIRELIKI